jgi:hypothetical protein
MPVQRAYAGDIDSAKTQLEKVKVDVDNGTWDSAQDDIKATELFLDGVPDADRAPVQKELDGLKIKVAAGLKAYKSKAIVDGSKRDLDSAADTLANSPVDVTDRIDKVIETLKSDDAKKYVDPDQLAKLQARADSLHGMAMAKNANQKLETAGIIFKELDEKMAGNPFKTATTDEDLQHVTQDLSSLESRIRGAIDGIPAADPRVKAINDKLAAYDKQIAAASGGVAAKAASEQLARIWKSEQEYFAGWDQEKKGPTWEEYTHHQSQDMGNLNMTKTVELMRRLPGWFTEDFVKSTADQYKDEPQVKATLAEAHKDFDDAAAKLHNAFGDMLSQAEKLDTPKDGFVREQADRLVESASNWFKGTQYADADIARAKALSDKWKNAVAGAAAAQVETLNKLTAQATGNWPAIAAAMKAEDGFTPDKLDQFKGKTIHITGNNRCGWDYNPGEYVFAKDINGIPVAGKFDATVAAAVKATTKLTGQDLPDEAWDLYGTVEGPGQIKLRTHSEGKVKVDGQDVGTVTSEGEKAVDCAVIRIIALHAGPVAVGPGSAPVEAPAGAVAADGSTPTPLGAAPARAVAGGFIEHLFELLLCIAAAGVVILKARPAVAAQVAGSNPSMQSLATNDNIALVGLAMLVLGALWLLGKLILGDLLPAGALTLAGIYIASDWLLARKLLPPNIANSLKPLGMPIAGAVVLFGFLHLFLAPWYLF